MAKQGMAVEALPPVIVYAAMNPLAPVRETAVAPMLNAGLSAAETAGVTEPVRNEDGWNWGTTTALGLGLLLLVANFISREIMPGWLNTVPPWLVYGYLFGLMPGVALAGMITARIRGAEHQRWLVRAREIVLTSGDKLVYMGEADGDDQTYTSHLIERIQRARTALLLRADDDSALKVQAALSSLAEYITHPSPEPLPATAGMLDTAVVQLRERQSATAASAEAAHARMVKSLESLESMARITDDRGEAVQL